MLSSNHVGQKLADGVELREKVDLDCHLHPLGRAFDEVSGVGNTSLGGAGQSSQSPSRALERQESHIVDEDAGVTKLLSHFASRLCNRRGLAHICLIEDNWE